MRNSTPYLALGALGAALFLAACGSSDDSTPSDEGQPFYKGAPSPAATGTGGAAGSGGGTTNPGPTLITEPPFTAVQYPSAPYGTQLGSVIDNYEFLGWHKPADVAYDVNQFQKVSFADFYNPAGDKPAKVIMLNASAVWCTVCRAEYAKFKADGTYEKYRQQGVEFIGAIFEDSSNPPLPAKPSDLQWWGDNFGVAFPLVLDPGFKLGRFFTADATPMNLLITTHDMKIVGKYLGGNTTAMFEQLDQLIAQ